MFERYDDPDSKNDKSKWSEIRESIKRIFLQEGNPMQIGSIRSRKAKTFSACIQQEVKNELREDAETWVLKECKTSYEKLIKKGYFKIENQHFNEFEDGIWQRDRLNVMSAILYPLDNKNCFATTLAIVNKNGELAYQKDLNHLLPPRVSKRPE